MWMAVLRAESISLDKKGIREYAREKVEERCEIHIARSQTFYWRLPTVEWNLSLVQHCGRTFLPRVGLKTMTLEAWVSRGARGVRRGGVWRESGLPRRRREIAALINPHPHTHTTTSHLHHSNTC